MQASQIDPSKLYALKVIESQRTYIARFKVWTVESHMRRRNLKPTSADYTHKIHGIIDERDVPPDLLPADETARQEYLKRTVDPAVIEDEYYQYQELVARAAAEKANAEAAEAERSRKAQELKTLLYHFTGLTWVEGRDKPYETSYRGGLGMNEKGVAALLKLLTDKLGPMP